MNQLMVLNPGPVGSRIIITNPNWLTNEVVGVVLHETAMRLSAGIVRDKSALVYSRDEVDAMVQRMPCDVTVSMVLEMMGLAMAVDNSSSNEIVPVTSHADSAIFISGLVDTPMPSEIRNACLQPFRDSITIVMQSAFHVLEKNTQSSLRVVRSVSRLFSLQNQRCCFIPGFHMKLFMFIHNLNSCPERCWYWKDGMVMTSMVRWTVKNVSHILPRLVVVIVLTQNCFVGYAYGDGRQKRNSALSLQ